MAEYITTDTELTSVADAIRAKGGTSAALTYPAGFVSAIEAIPTGGGLTVTDLTKSRTAFNAPDNPEDLVFSASATGLNIAICTLRNSYSDSYEVVTYLYQVVHDVGAFDEEHVVFRGVCTDNETFLAANFNQQNGTYEISEILDEVNGEDVTVDWYIESCRIYHG